MPNAMVVIGLSGGVVGDGSGVLGGWRWNEMKEDDMIEGFLEEGSSLRLNGCFVWLERENETERIGGLLEHRSSLRPTAQSFQSVSP